MAQSDIQLFEELMKAVDFGPEDARKIITIAETGKIPKGSSKLVALAGQALKQSSKLRGDIFKQEQTQQGKVQLLQEKNANTRAGRAQTAEISAEARAQAADITSQSREEAFELKKRATRELPVQSTLAGIESAQITEQLTIPDSIVQDVRREAEELRRILNDTKSPLPVNFRERMAILEGTPDGVKLKEALERNLTARQTVAKADMENFILKHPELQGQEKAALVERAGELGRQPFPAVIKSARLRGQEALSLVETQGSVLKSVQATLQEGGINTTVTPGESGSAGTLTLNEPEGFFAKTSPSGTRQKLVTQITELAQAGRGDEALSLAKKVAPAVRKAGLGRAGLVGGGLLALLGLPALLSGRNGQQGQGQLPPLLQLQLMQQLSQIQNNQAQTQSLVSSRGAQANESNAKANLLQLQAAQLLGGGAGGII